MARRRLTEAEEARMVAAAERSRDDKDTAVRKVDVRVAADASGVLSVRLRIEQIRTLRQIAAQRGESLSDLLQEAVTQMIGTCGLDVSTSQSLNRIVFYVSGGLPAARTTTPQPIGMSSSLAAPTTV
jgi:hypothetical protein